MRVALALRFRDRAGAPVRIEFHDAAIIARVSDRSQARRFDCGWDRKEGMKGRG